MQGLGGECLLCKGQISPGKIIHLHHSHCTELHQVSVSWGRGCMCPQCHSGDESHTVVLGAQNARITDLTPRDCGWGELALLATGAARAARPGLDAQSLVTGGSHPKCHRSHMSGQHVSRGTRHRLSFEPTFGPRHPPHPSQLSVTMETDNAPRSWRYPAHPRTVLILLQDGSSH